MYLKCEIIIKRSNMQFKKYFGGCEIRTNYVERSQPPSKRENKNNKLFFRPELLAGVGVAILPATGTAARTV